MNTVVSGFMEFTNKLIEIAKKENGIDQKTLDTLAVLLAPFTPHFAEEIWKELGHNDSVFLEKWPICDESKLKVDTVEIAIQINGKMKENLVISVDDTSEEVLKNAKLILGNRLDGKIIVKEIYVPKRIVNIVVK